MSICQNHVQDITEVTILKYYRLRHIVTSNIRSKRKFSANFGKLFTNFFSFMYFEFLLAPLYHFLDLNNACLLFLRIAELLIIE